MSLIAKFFKPRLDSPDPEIRLQALRDLPAGQDDTLASLVASDPDRRVRLAALERIPLDRLDGLCGGVTDPETQAAVEARWLAGLLDFLRGGAPVQEKLVRLERVDRDAALAQAAVEAPEPEVRLAAVNRMTDQNLLADVLTRQCGRQTALAALEKITDPGLLVRVEASAASRTVRAAAAARIAAMREAAPRTEEEIRAERIEALLNRARALPGMADIEKAEAEVGLLGAEAGPAGLDAGHPGRVEFDGLLASVGERRQRIQEKVLEQEARDREHQARLADLDALAGEIEALLGSDRPDAATVFQDLRGRWETMLAGLQKSYPAELHDRFKKACERFATHRPQAERELAALAAFAERLDALLAKSVSPEATLKDLNRLGQDLGEARFRFVRSTALAARIEEVKRLLQGRIEERERLREEARLKNLGERQGLVARLESMLDGPLPDDVAEQLKTIRREWGQAADLPATAPDLGPRYQELLGQVNEAIRTQHKEHDWQHWANRGKMEELIRQVDALDTETDLHAVYQGMRAAQAAWQALGAAPPDEANRLWAKFQKITRKQFERCRGFFEQLEKQAHECLEQKTKLCEEAEALRDSSDWDTTAALYRDLQARWKTIGRAPKDLEPRMYARFRAACDVFFQRRQAHFDEEDRQRLGNQTAKEALCQEAEALLADPKPEMTRNFRELQKKWKKIPSAPRKQERLLWQRFKTAGDRFYAWLDARRPENLQLKIALCVEVEAIAVASHEPADWVPMTRKVIALQEQWETIGPVPDGETEAIWQRFRGACDQFFAAKSVHDAEVDRGRAVNEQAKLALLERLTQAIGANNERETPAEISKIQQEWRGVGAASRENDRELERQFRFLCDTYFRNRRLSYREMDRQRQENLKLKEALLVRLEFLNADKAELGKITGQNQSLTLAEQFKLVREARFLTAGQDRQDEQRRRKDEFEKIQREWSMIGPVPREQEKSLARRYRDAVAALRERLRPPTAAPAQAGKRAPETSA